MNPPVPSHSVQPDTPYRDRTSDQPIYRESPTAHNDHFKDVMRVGLIIGALVLVFAFLSFTGKMPH